MPREVTPDVRAPPSASVAVALSGSRASAGSDSFLVSPASERPWKSLRCERSGRQDEAAYDQDPAGYLPGAPRSCGKCAGQPRAEPGSICTGGLAPRGGRGLRGTCYSGQGKRERTPLLRLNDRDQPLPLPLKCWALPPSCLGSPSTSRPRSPASWRQCEPPSRSFAVRT